MSRNTKAMGSFTLALELLQLSGGHALAQEAVVQERAGDGAIRPSLQDWRDPLPSPSRFRNAPAYPRWSGEILHRVSGQVLRVNESTRTLVLRLGSLGPTVHFWVDPQAVVAQGRYPLEVSDLEVGDWTKVEYLAKGDTRVAQEIRVQ